MRKTSRWQWGTAALTVMILMGSTPVWATSRSWARHDSMSPARVLRYDGPGSGPDYPAAVAVAGDGARFFVAGSAYGGPTNGDDYATIAYGPKGRRLWLRSYNGPDSNIDQALDVAVAPGGGMVFVTGYSFGGPATTNDATTIAYDAADGDVLWIARYNGPGNDTDVGVDVVVAPDGQTVFVTGASIGSDGMLDVLTIAYQAETGVQAWVSRFGEGNAASDEGLSIGMSPAGDRVYVTGYQTVSDADFITLAYSAGSGDEVWRRSVDAGGDELGRSLTVAPDGSSVYVTGYRSGVPGGVPLACLSGDLAVGDDYITVAYDAVTGRRRWMSNYDGPDHDCDQAYGIAIAPDGSTVFVTGSSFSLTSDSDAATVAYGTADGTELWSARFDGPDHLYDTGDSLVVSPDGDSLYVAGTSTGAATDYDFMTLFYEVSTGGLLRAERYDGPGHGFDAPNAIAMHPSGRAIYVTGGSTGSNLDPDFATVVYRTGPG
jgi:hypothetical protein